MKSLVIICSMSTHPHGEKIDYNQNPFIVIWEVTRACELKCIHCRADAQPLPNPESLVMKKE